MIGSQKVLNSDGVPAYTSTDRVNTASPLHIRFWVNYGGTWSSRQDGVMSVSNGTINLNPSVEVMDRYFGDSDHFRLPEAVVTPHDITVNYQAIKPMYSVQVIPDPGALWAPGTLKTPDQDENRPIFNWDNVNSYVGDPAHPINLVRMANALKVYGKVIDTDGNPIVGATVALAVSGGDAFPNVTQTTVADVGGSSPGCQFEFNNQRFVPISGINLTLTVSAPGYDNFSDSIEGYDGIQWHRDFILIRPTNYGGGSAVGGNF